MKLFSILLLTQLLFGLEAQTAEATEHPFDVAGFFLDQADRVYASDLSSTNKKAALNQYLQDIFIENFSDIYESFENDQEKIAAFAIEKELMKAFSCQIEAHIWNQVWRIFRDQDIGIESWKPVRDEIKSYISAYTAIHLPINMENQASLKKTERMIKASSMLWAYITPESRSRIDDRILEICKKLRFKNDNTSECLKEVLDETLTYTTLIYQASLLNLRMTDSYRDYIRLLAKDPEFDFHLIGELFANHGFTNNYLVIQMALLRKLILN